MNVTNSFTKTVDLLHRAMDASSIRQAVIANNIANADVPNFKRSNVNFESELKRALDTEKYRPALELRLTNPKHISDWEPRDYQDVEVRRVLDYVSTENANGNNVNAEEEFNLALENQLKYMILANSATFEFSQVNMVLKS
jgi:flagellar basal-body rod protein FlgB